MKILNHTLGFPRIGINRELKKSLENYWKKIDSKKKLLNTGKKIRLKNWKQQKKLGINLIPVGDFSLYDHVLNNSMMLGNIPKRYIIKKKINIDTFFYMARGYANKKISIQPCEMKKWFNTNYHYIVPEFYCNQNFKLSWYQLFEEINEALKITKNIKPILLGPITYLWLGKKYINNFNKLSLLPKILKIYQKIIKKISEISKIKWIQIDEPVLTLELSKDWKKAYLYAYNSLSSKKLKIILTTYFDHINHNIKIIQKFNINGLHVDFTKHKNILYVHENIPSNWILSIGIINGKNIWKANLKEIYKKVSFFTNKRKIWIGTSCSLIHVPIDLKKEKNIKKNIKKKFSFAIQKCNELYLLTKALNNTNNKKYKKKIYKYNQPITFKQSNIIQKNTIKIKKSKTKRTSNFLKRYKIQQIKHNIPIYPTTTIGSFPQTEKIRNIRNQFKNKKINFNIYKKEIKKCIKKNIKKQEKIGLDILVHGEPERNDMVEYFGENLKGFIITQNGWIQSYGSRCVKPPIIIGNISRKYPITISWTKYAKKLTKHPIKGILTGPITILFWSFIREDIKKKTIAKQIALSIKSEVLDLEKNKINIIQIDEPALREGLPIKKSKWKKYLNWAIKCFKSTFQEVNNKTQIHTHMCYCNLKDIMHAIIKMDVDVISIESARSDMKLLKIFKKFNYLKNIGFGIYDIHSKIIPNIKDIILRIKKIIKFIPINRIWINPDCGLKTRNWKETKKSLKNMVKAAKKLRKKYNSKIYE